MFTIHGKQLRVGFKPSDGGVGKNFPGGSEFLPFPPLLGVTVSLPAGLFQVTQIGIVPLVGLLELNIPPTDVTIQFTIDKDYPYWGQLFSTAMKSPVTLHLPPFDIRICTTPPPGYSIYPTINLWNCLFRRANFVMGEKYATASFTFTSPYGLYIPHTSEEVLPPTSIPMSDAVRRFDMTAIVHAGDKEDIAGLGDARFSISSIEFDVQASVALSLTMPNLVNAFFPPSSPYEPIPISMGLVAHEGAFQYAGNVRVLLPPLGTVPFPFHTTFPQHFTFIVQTPPFTITFEKAKLLSFNPSLNPQNHVEVTLQFWGLGFYSTR